MAELHWRCTYLANIYDKDKFDGLSGYKFEFTDDTIRIIFFETEYGNALEDVEKNNSSIEAAEEKLTLFSEGWVYFDDGNPYYFPLMNDEEIERVNNGELYRGNRLVSVGVAVELDGYDPYVSEPEKRANAQYLNFDWSYNDFNGGDGEFEEIEPVENNIEMAQAPVIPTTKWLWKTCCIFNVSGTTNTSQPVYYPLNEFRLQVFSGTNLPGIATFFSGNTPVTIFSTGTSHLQYENILSTTTVSSDSGQNYFPMDFWTLAQQGIYSAITDENFYYSISGAGHQAAVFSGRYSIFGICVEHGGIHPHDPSDINYNVADLTRTDNNSILNANYFSLLVFDEFNDAGISMVDVGLGHAGSALTGLYGRINVISSAKPYSDGMPCFVSRIGSPGEFVVVPPNNTYELYLKSTGEVASTNRARSLWAMFDDSSSLYYNDIGGKLGFTPNDIYNAGNLANKFWFSDGYQQNGNRLILTSDMLGYVGTPNYFVNESLSTNWTYLNYEASFVGEATSSGDISLYPGGNEILVGTINVSANTKYIIGLPCFLPGPGDPNRVFETDFIFRIGTNYQSFNPQHFYRGPDWNKNANKYYCLGGKWMCPGALLFKTPSNYYGTVNLYVTLTQSTDVDMMENTKVLSTTHTIFYHPILKDNYLDIYGPRPIDASDM